MIAHWHDGPSMVCVLYIFLLIIFFLTTMFRYYYAIKVRTTTQWCDDNRIVFSAIIIILIVYNVISSCVILTRETREWPVNDPWNPRNPWPVPAKPLPARRGVRVWRVRVRVGLEYPRVTRGIPYLWPPFATPVVTSPFRLPLSSPSLFILVPVWESRRQNCIPFWDL